MLSRRQRHVSAFLAACAAAGFLLTAPAAGQPGSSSGGTGAASTPAATTPPAEKKYVNVPSGEVVKREEREGGLIVEDLKIGEGYEVKDNGVVVVHYHGTLKADPKKVFDSSYAEDRGQPITFPLKSVIAGWQKGVPGMKIGGVRRLTVPAAMAYGDRSPSPDIPANSDLVFIIELVDALQIEDIKVGDGQDARPPFAACVKQTVKDKDGKDLTMDGEHLFI